MPTTGKQPLLKTKVQKKPIKTSDGSSVSYDNEIRFENNVGDQRGVKTA